MTQSNDVVPVTFVPIEDNVTNKIFVTVNGQDWQKDLNELGLSFDSSEEAIMDIVVPTIQEEFNQDISDSYKVRKAVNSQNIYVIPSSVAGYA